MTKLVSSILALLCIAGFCTCTITIIWLTAQVTLVLLEGADGEPCKYVTVLTKCFMNTYAIALLHYLGLGLFKIGRAFIEVVKTEK